MDAAEVVEGGVWLDGDACALAGVENLVEAIDYERGMGALGGSEIGLDTEMQIYGASEEPEAFAFGHLRRLFDFGEAEDAGVEGSGAILALDGYGDLDVV